VASFINKVENENTALPYSHIYMNIYEKSSHTQNIHSIRKFVRATDISTMR